MIPLRDSLRPSRVPLVNYSLIALNVAVWLYELSLGPKLETLLRTWGLVPSDLRPLQLVTSTFLHGGWFHLLGNMLFLHIFGDNVEDRLGHGRYLALYLLSGVAAGAAQALAVPASDVPMVGASGAIAGVAGAYLLFFPRAKVVTVVPLFLFLHVIEVPAILYLVAWFCWQLASGVSTIGQTDGEGGVAFWAHVGGFVVGMILGPALRRPAAQRARVRRHAN
jgi:membrane associated rhomboid family serine protease